MFVDIHSHILHGLDDGARTIDESVEMLEIARRTGTTDIVATPHANSRYPFRPERIDERIAALTGRVDIRIHRGCDFHLEMGNIQAALADPRKYTIDGGEYLLVELPEATLFANTESILQRLMDAGMVPIITHPERNAMLQRSLDELAQWVDVGCYVQVTAGSFLGLFGKRPESSAHELLDAGLVHFVASDGHDPRVRTPSLRETYEYLVERTGDDRIRPLFVENPMAVLTGGTIEIDITPRRRKARKWYQFW
jgi:protein-tyrosine phosphatase